jgi:hypothetical protein
VIEKRKTKVKVEREREREREREGFLGGGSTLFDYLEFR